MKNLFSFILAMFLVSSLSGFAQPEQTVLRDHVQHIMLNISFTPPPQPKSLTPRFQDLFPGNVGPIIRKHEFAGSAVVLAPGYALSSYHIFEAAENYASRILPDIVVTRDYTSAPNGSDDRSEITVVATDVEHDLVLLKGNFKCPCIPILHGEPLLDETVYNVGFPIFNYHGVQMVTKGTYQGITNENMYFVSAHTTSGGSGGGAYQKDTNDEWRLIGVVNAVTILGQHQQMTWMVLVTPIHLIHPLVAGIPEVANFIIRE